jgi:uncharacterized membrane protein
MPSHSKPAHYFSPDIQDDSVGLERLVFFSDAVFAIATTLLALDIRLPANSQITSDAGLLSALNNLGPKYLGYVISFMVISVYWFSHHRMFRRIRRYNGRLLVINMFLLMAIAFVPFPTSVMSQYGNNRSATIFYAATMVVVGLLTALVWLYASWRGRLLDHPDTPTEHRLGLIRMLSAPAVFLVSIGLAFVDPGLARYSWILIGLAIFIR